MLKLRGYFTHIEDKKLYFKPDDASIEKLQFHCDQLTKTPMQDPVNPPSVTLPYKSGPYKNNPEDVVLTVKLPQSYKVVPPDIEAKVASDCTLYVKLEKREFESRFEKNKGQRIISVSCILAKIESSMTLNQTN